MNPEVEVQHVSLSSSGQTKEPRPSNNPVLQERASITSEVPQTSQRKASSRNLPPWLQLACPSKEEVRDERCDKYQDMKETRKQSKTKSEKIAREIHLKDKARVTAIAQLTFL